jgi:hypothetical protein
MAATAIRRTMIAAAPFLPRLDNIATRRIPHVRECLSLWKVDYQACGSPQCGQRTEAVTTAWKADPQRQT